MAKYQLSNKTKIDLIDIWDYTVRTWSVNQAERYYNQTPIILSVRFF